MCNYNNPKKPKVKLHNNGVEINVKAFSARIIGKDFLLDAE